MINKTDMLADIERVLVPEADIHARIKEVGAQIAADYRGKCPILVGVLKGVVVFFSDFIKNFTEDCQIDFMWISSYAGANSTGAMEVKRDVAGNLKGRHVVILEDIFDTGTSLQYTYHHLLAKEPASLKICTLLDKPERRKPGITVTPDYTGFVIPNEFVVGYGLDYNEQYRNLPFIGILDPKVYQS